MEGVEWVKIKRKSAFLIDFCLESMKQALACVDTKTRIMVGNNIL